MPNGPWDSLAWWQLSLAANMVNTIACFAMISYVYVALVRRRQLTTNKLAIASMVVFFVFGLQRALQIFYQLGGLFGPDGAQFARRLAANHSYL
ncbi:hypothetical protein, partial [Bradyrhizobium sp. NBAIM08]|uniref:hypothetical protein n=1 Tax=Bradyrhizobium sp. NBAIM08 TaxID=2793815 RepID=UPI001CD29C71